MKPPVQDRPNRLIRTWTIAAAIVTTGAIAIPAMAQTTVSAQQADQIAQNAIAGSTLVHTSADHMGGAPVWDIHVARGSQVWDVKVSTQSGAVLMKRLSSEQPASSRVTSFSGSPSANEHDHGGDAQDRRQSIDRQTSQDHRSIQDLKDYKDRSGDAQDRTDAKDLARTASATGGVVFNQKLTVVPATYQPYVTQALNSVGGTLKWVKFSRQSGGNTQMNIKIHKPGGGTTKINEVFNSSGQLSSQNTQADN